MYVVIQESEADVAPILGVFADRRTAIAFALGLETTINNQNVCYVVQEHELRS